MPKRVNEKRKSVLVSLDPAVHAAAAILADKYGHTFSHVVEEMLKLWIRIGEDHDQT